MRLFRLELPSKVKRNSWCQPQSYQRGNIVHILKGKEKKKLTDSHVQGMGGTELDLIVFLVLR